MFIELDTYAVTTSISLKNAGVIKHDYTGSTALRTIYPPDKSVQLTAQLLPGIKIMSWTIDG